MKIKKTVKLKVTPDGREGIWLIEKENIIDFLNQYLNDQIHNFLGSGSTMVIGADWDKTEVIAKINQSDKIAILTGESLKSNLNHALSVIANNKLYMFDIGEIKEENLQIN